MLDPSSSEEESDELLDEERRDALLAAGGGSSPRSLPPPPRDPRGREGGAGRAASPSPSVLSEGREEQERLQREEREKRLRLQLYVFIARCIAHPFNAKQPTDMARRQQKVSPAPPPAPLRSAPRSGPQQVAAGGGAGSPARSGATAEGNSGKFAERRGSPRRGSRRPGPLCGCSGAAVRARRGHSSTTPPACRSPSAPEPLRCQCGRAVEVSGKLLRFLNPQVRSVYTEPLNVPVLMGAAF